MPLVAVHKKRIVFNIFLVASVIYMPWWVTAVLAVAGVFMFKRFYEIVAVGVLMDLLYGVPAPRFFNFWFVFTIGSLAVYLAAMKVKESLRF